MLRKLFYGVVEIRAHQKNVSEVGLFHIYSLHRFLLLSATRSLVQSILRVFLEKCTTKEILVQIL